MSIGALQVDSSFVQINRLAGVGIICFRSLKKEAFCHMFFFTQIFLASGDTYSGG